VARERRVPQEHVAALEHLFDEPLVSVQPAVVDGRAALAVGFPLKSVDFHEGMRRSREADDSDLQQGAASGIDHNSERLL
jgi:hypothetical protein